MNQYCCVIMLSCQFYSIQENKLLKKVIKCRDGSKNILNKPKVGMAEWTSLHSSHNIYQGHNSLL